MRHSNNLKLAPECCLYFLLQAGKRCVPDAPVESKAYKREIRFLADANVSMIRLILLFCRPGFDGKNPGTPAYTYGVVPKGTYAGDRPFNGFETVRGQ